MFGFRILKSIILIIRVLATFQSIRDSEYSITCSLKKKKKSEWAGALLGLVWFSSCITVGVEGIFLYEVRVIQHGAVCMYTGM